MMSRAETTAELLALGEWLAERDFWLNYEEISCSGTTLSCPLGEPERRGRWIERDSTPTTYPYRLVVENVVSWNLEHSGGYPFSQPLDGIIVDTDSEFRLLGRAGSVCRVTVSAILVSVIDVTSS